MKSIILQSACKSLFLFSAIFLVNSSNVMADQNPNTAKPFNLNGAYAGRYDDREDIDLLVREIPGREGSYLGVLIQMDPGLVIYRIDPLTPNSYAMNPIGVTEDGELGVNNDDPSLVLTLGAFNSKSGKPDFTITPANSGNSTGFVAPMVFHTEDHSIFTWLPYDSGLYKQTTNSDHELSLAQMISWEAPASSNKWGNSVIQEKITGVFTMKKVTVSSTGTQMDIMPRGFGIFVNRHGFWGVKTLFVMVSPKDFRDLTIFSQKK